MDATTQSEQLAPALPLKQLRPGALTVLHGVLIGDLAPDQTARLTCTEFADLLALGKYGIDEAALTKEQQALWKAWQADQVAPDPTNTEAAWRIKLLAAHAEQGQARAAEEASRAATRAKEAADRARVEAKAKAEAEAKARAEAEANAKAQPKEGPTT